MSKKGKKLQESPIILVHGLRGSPLGLREIKRDLEKVGYKVYAPAVPPFAGAKPLEAYSNETYADFLANFIKKKKLKKPILIGHSMGSIIVAVTAERYPELVGERIILMSPISTKPAKFFAALTPLSALFPARLVDYLTTRYLFVPKDRTLFRKALAITHDCSNDHPPKKRDILASAKFSAFSSITDFDFLQKTLLLAGETDRLIKKSATEQLAKKLGATAIFIPDSGHLHNYEKPHETATEIIRFLSA